MSRAFVVYHNGIGTRSTNGRVCVPGPVPCTRASSSRLQYPLGFSAPPPQFFAPMHRAVVVSYSASSRFVASRPRPALAAALVIALGASLACASHEAKPGTTVLVDTASYGRGTTTLGSAGIT